MDTLPALKQAGKPERPRHGEFIRLDDSIRAWLATLTEEDRNAVLRGMAAER